jgi:large subunit ribosomal protein L4
MYRGAMQSMLSELARQDRLIVIESIEIDAPKTKTLVGKLKELNFERGLILLEGYDEKVELAARNVPYLEVLPASALDPVSLARHDRVLATVAAIKQLEEKLS